MSEWAFESEAKICVKLPCIYNLISVQYITIACLFVFILITSKLFFFIHCLIVKCMCAMSSHKWHKCQWVNPQLSILQKSKCIAPWFRLHLPTCGPGFESQAQHLYFFQLILLKLHLCLLLEWEKDENKHKKRSRLAHLKNQNTFNKFYKITSDRVNFPCAASKAWKRLSKINFHIDLKSGNLLTWM